jgi:hypothetical protein
MARSSQFSPIGKWPIMTDELASAKRRAQSATL